MLFSEHSISTITTLFDTSTALYYYGARYYDPELGRFIQPDTIVPYPSDPQSFNRYAYARNNPIRYVDPTGHSWLDDIKGWFEDVCDFISDVIEDFIGWLEDITGSDWSVNVSVSTSTSFGPGGDGGPGTYDPNEPVFTSGSPTSTYVYTSPTLSLLNAASLLTPKLLTDDGLDLLTEEIEELIDFGVSPDAAVVIAGQKLSVAQRVFLVGTAGNFAGAVGMAIDQFNQMVSAEIRDYVEFQIRAICLQVSRETYKGSYAEIEVFVDKYTGGATWTYTDSSTEWLTDVSTLHGRIIVQGRRPYVPPHYIDEFRKSYLQNVPIFGF